MKLLKSLFSDQCHFPSILCEIISIFLNSVDSLTYYQRELMYSLNNDSIN